MEEAGFFVHNEIDIQADPEVVWNLLIRAEEWPQWYVGMSNVKVQTATDGVLHDASIVSFNAVLMAWYGVNFVLGTGLHSYGFGSGGSDLLIASVVGFDLLLVLTTVARHSGWLKRQALTPADNL